MSMEHDEEERALFNKWITDGKPTVRPGDRADPRWRSFNSFIEKEWRVAKSDQPMPDDWNLGELVICDDVIIAATIDAGSPVIMQQRVNARLIAKAPSLLMACTALIDRCKISGAKRDDSINIPINGAILNNIRRAMDF